MFTEISSLFLHGSDRTVFVSQKKLLQLGHLVPQQTHFILKDMAHTIRKRHLRQAVQLTQTSVGTNICYSSFCQGLLCKSVMMEVLSPTMLDCFLCGGGRESEGSLKGFGVRVKKCGGDSQ